MFYLNFDELKEICNKHSFIKTDVNGSAEAVKNSGINYVTTSNIHLLDKGIKGAMRTLDILDKYNISHIPGAINIEYLELLSNPSKYLNMNEACSSPIK